MRAGSGAKWDSEAVFDACSCAQSLQNEANHHIPGGGASAGKLERPYLVLALNAPEWSRDGGTGGQASLATVARSPALRSGDSKGRATWQSSSVLEAQHVDADSRIS